MPFFQGRDKSSNQILQLWCHAFHAMTLFEVAYSVSGHWGCVSCILSWEMAVRQGVPCWRPHDVPVVGDAQALRRLQHADAQLS